MMDMELYILAQTAIEIEHAPASALLWPALLKTGVAALVALCLLSDGFGGHHAQLMAHLALAGVAGTL
jgi:hypothetical protein